MKQYTINYMEDNLWNNIKEEIILAKNSSDAYIKFMDNNGWKCYAAWVSHYTTQKGDIHYFNTCPGNPY